MRAVRRTILFWYHSHKHIFTYTPNTHTHTHTGTEKLSDDFLRNILRAAKQSQKFEEKLDDMYAYVVFECGVRVLIFENFHLVITRIALKLPKVSLENQHSNTRSNTNTNTRSNTTGTWTILRQYRVMRRSTQTLRVNFYSYSVLILFYFLRQNSRVLHRSFPRNVSRV